MWARFTGIFVMLGACVIGTGACLEADQGDGQPFDQCTPSTCPPCAPAPRCGEACASACGCGLAYGSGCSSEGIVMAGPNFACYDVLPCSAPNLCVVGPQGAVCAESKDDCDAVRAAYEGSLLSLSPSDTIVRSGSGALTAGTYPSSCPFACKVFEGHCAQGLDTCWFLSYAADPELDRLANLYQSLGCPSLGPCDCPPKPSASCEYDSSQATASYSGPLKCTVK